ncbi:MAG TPA: NAD-dependent epimerase/dehydratase family protein [Candidatus Portnoybacteria bacterium]|nr:NAD-dependent epimerase/dehydratase family protein [Candidatus Portnoybacteria bacterium]
MKILVTGAAGYIGGMLTDLFLKDSRVEKVVALDMKDASAKFPKGDPKLTWLTFNLGDNGWQEEVLKGGKPDVVVHCAYVIREGFGKKRAWQNKCNFDGAENVFNFVFKNDISRLIDFSTVASYGARLGNTVERKFKEEDPFMEEKYLYGVDKKIIEENLKALFAQEKAALASGQRQGALPQVLVLRPAAISGPRGQFIFRRFGLLMMIKEGLPLIPLCGRQSARQFIHEDDVADIIFWLAFGGVKSEYEVFNIAPNQYFLLKDMAHTLGKPVLPIPLWLGRLGFSFLWYVFRGRVPTVPAGINSYAYPIIADGSKITRFGYQYKFTGEDALLANKGRYSEEAKKYRK